MREERGEAIVGIISGATNTTYGRCILDRLILYSNEGCRIMDGEVKLCTLKKSSRSSLSSSRRVKQKIDLSKCILDIYRISIDIRIQRLIRIKTAGSGRCYAYAYQNETRIIREKNLIDEKASRLAIVQPRKASLSRENTKASSTSSNCTGRNPVVRQSPEQWASERMRLRGKTRS